MARAPRVLVLAFDIGSSSARTALFDARGRAVAGTDAQRQYSLQYTADGGALLSPSQLLRAVRACRRETLGSRRAIREIAAVGGSAFWHGLLGLDRNGQPITPVFTWADSRSAADAARLRREFEERKIHAATGCMLRASFWPAKLRWLRRTNGTLFRKVDRWVSPVDWIFAEIFGTIGTSDSMASATGLYDLRTKSWHNELCRACGVTALKLGAITEGPAGTGAAVRELKNAMVFNAIGDGAAGNLGSGATRPGQVAINVGTSAAVRMMEHRGDRRVTIPFGLFRYAVDRKRTVIGGAISNAGNLHQWCLHELRLRGGEHQALRRSFAASDDLTVLPFWVSERAPTWPENLHGAILGLTQSTDAAEILRATACASFYRLADILELLEKKNGRARQLIVSGGIARAKDSLPLLADALGRDISVSPQAEASLRGAAVYVLEKLGCDPAPLPKAKIIRHNSGLAKRHRRRRERQAALEAILSIPKKTPSPHTRR